MKTRLGSVIIASCGELFEQKAAMISALADSGTDRPVVALTGGSTPKAFYNWVVERRSEFVSAWKRLYWTVSDERMLPLGSEESNFGNADRAMLQPLGVLDGRKFPWPVEVDPHSAGILLNRQWHEQFGPDRVIDLCFLGMGDDGHTASLFPGSPLLGGHIAESFACVEVPEKGWRLTITEAGLAKCRQVVVVVTGMAKAERVQAVFEEPIGQYPIQCLAGIASRVTWLIDEDAADRMSRG